MTWNSISSRVIAPASPSVKQKATDSLSWLMGVFDT